MTGNCKVIKFESSREKLVSNISQLFQCYMVNWAGSFLRLHVVSSPENHLEGDLFRTTHLVIRPKLNTIISPVLFTLPINI